MTPREAERDREWREAKATEWLCERAEGFTRERADAFARWLAEDARNPAAVQQVERTLELLDQLPEMRAPLEAKYGQADWIVAADTAEKISPERRRWFRPAWAAGLAAMLVVAAVVGWSVQSQQSGERFATSASGRQRVPLQDGSVIDLNGASEVRVQFSPERRNVTLQAGEAHFAVAPDPARPFVVTAGDVLVRAIGTAFNVRRTGESVDVIVTEGKVEVVREGVPVPVAARVSAGERMCVAAEVSAAAIEKVEPAAMRTLLAWQNRITNFTDVPLRELVGRFNRHNATQLVLADAKLGERTLGGVFALDQVEVFVRMLEQNGEVVAERRGEAEIVLRASR